jgi:hypothetical protein
MNAKCSSILGSFALLASALGAAAQSGGSFTLHWQTLDGGGGPASGGSFSLNGTIGQPDAGAMSGGVFTLQGGFWNSSADVTPEPRPRLSIRHGAGNSVILLWPNPSTGYVLQQTADMSATGGSWTEVTTTPVVNGANKEVTLLATGNVCFFRLRPQ